MEIKVRAEGDEYQLNLVVADGAIDNWEMYKEVNSDKYTGVAILHSQKYIFVQLNYHSDFVKALEWIASKLTTNE